MLQRLNVPIIGVVENMSAFVCPHCGEATEIFGRGGGERFAEQHGIDFLGKIPLDVTVRQGGDAGVPAVAQREPGAAARGARGGRRAGRRADEHPGGLGPGAGALRSPDAAWLDAAPSAAGARGRAISATLRDRRSARCRRPVPSTTSTRTSTAGRERRDAPLPPRRGRVPPGRPGRRAVHRAERAGQDLEPVRRRRRGDPRDPARRASSSGRWRCSTARRAPRRRPRSTRPRP